MRAENEEKMKRGFEKTTKDLKKELAETKTILTQDSVNNSSLMSENRRMKAMLEKEKQTRRKLETSLDETNRELQNKSFGISEEEKRIRDNYVLQQNTIPQRKNLSDPSQTLARMKARLNQSINKYLDEKINNDGSNSEFWAQLSNKSLSGGSDGGAEDLSPRDGTGSRATSPSPRYMSVMKSNYYL